MKSNKIIVSVCCLAYNHESYIRKCLEGFLIQKTDFPFEILIHDDASTDGTEEIIREYEAKYPNIIKPLYEKENQWQKGRRGSAIFNFPRARGKYIVLCEGDDYWTDPYKLQKQVDFLEANPEYAMVAADVELIDKEGNGIAPNQMLLEQRTRAIKEPNFIDLLQGNLINTLTVCVRADIMKQLGERVKKENLWYVIDYWFWLNIAISHKIFIMDDVVAAYRISPDGVSRKPNFLKNRMGWIKYDAIINYSRNKKDLKEKDKYFLYKTIYGVLVNSKFGSILWFKSLLWLLCRPYYASVIFFSKLRNTKIV